jgi:serine/threonine-protein kinase
MELRHGIRIGDYELVDEIGRGGMAQVWSVHDVRSGNTYAVKTLLPEFAGDAALQERLLREARNQCQLQHPSIVRAYGTFQSEGRTFILMELVNGESLETYLTRRRPLPMPEVRGIAKAVLSALGYAHSMRLVHRDLKPSNILLSNSGSIQIADFGIALVLGQKRITKFGAMGTPAYMSPEQIRTPLSIDERSDIYSFACVLYELVSGYPPFHFESGENDYLVREAHLTRKPQPLARHHPDTPPAFDEAILRALEKDPAARFSSCEEFAAALRLQIDTGIQAPTPRSRSSASASSGDLPRVIAPKSGTPGASASSGDLPRVIAPRSGTPSASVSSGDLPRVVAPKSSAPRGVTPRPATPPRPKPDSSPRPLTPVTGGGRSRLTPGTGSGVQPTASPRARTRERQRWAGIAAVSVAALLLLVAGVLWLRRGRAVQAPPAVPPTAQATAPETVPPVVESRKRAAPASDGGKAAAASPAQNADGAAVRSEPAAMAPLRRLFEQPKETAPASGETPPVGQRPQPLGPAPTVVGPESGVLQWSGAAPVTGGQVIIHDGTQLGGALSGDALPGVPVTVSVIGNPDVRITEAPGPGNSYLRLVLQVPANLNKPIRINWQMQKGGRP